MICKDCGQEVDKINKNKGICLRCVTRMTNAIHRGKEYVPLLVVKETDPKAYNRAIARMNNTNNKGKKRNTSTVCDIATINPKTDVNDFRNKYYKKVSEDITNAFNKAKITQSYLNYKNLDSFIETLYSLVQEDNFITEAKAGEQIFNNLSLLYRHSQENLDWTEIDKINDISYSLKALSELRRPTKELLDYYVTIDPVISYIKKDSELMRLLEEARINTMKKSENHENPKYYSEVDSSILPNKEFVELTDNKIKVYDCTVWCYNLNGDINRRLFRASGGIFAKNQTEAKLKFKAFLKDKFATVTYKDKDINIEEVESQEVVRKRFEEQNSKQ